MGVVGSVLSEDARAVLRRKTAAGWADPAIRAKRLRGILANPGGLRPRLADMTGVQRIEYRRLRRAGVAYKTARRMALEYGK